MVTSPGPQGWAVGQWLVVLGDANDAMSTALPYPSGLRPRGNQYR